MLFLLMLIATITPIYSNSDCVYASTACSSRTNSSSEEAKNAYLSIYTLYEHIEGIEIWVDNNIVDDYAARYVSFLISNI